MKIDWTEVAFYFIATVIIVFVAGSMYRGYKHREAMGCHAMPGEMTDEARAYCNR